MQRVLYLSLFLSFSLAFLAYTLSLSFCSRVRIKLKRFPQLQENQESPFVLNFLPVCVFVCLSVCVGVSTE